MGISTFPAASAASKTRYCLTLTSGTSWTVPTGVTYANVTLFGGGGGGGFSNVNTAAPAGYGTPGQRITNYLVTTPGASISYSIGTGGTTTFTGVTSATGGTGGASFANGSTGPTPPDGANGVAGGGGGCYQNGGGNGGAGSNGKIEIEYWV